MMRSSRFCFVATVNPLSLLCFLHIARLTAQAWNLPPVPRPPFTENFDPARADPIGRLTCEGPLPPWRLPKVGDWDPNEATLLEVCAKPQYGGHYSPDLQDQFRGNAGFCYQSTFGREGLTFASITDFVAFDNNHTHYPGGYGTLVNPRLQSYCMLRCRCTSDTGTLRNRLDQDTELFTGVGIRLDEYTDGYQVDLDRFDDFANPQRHFIRWENGKRKMHIISSGQQTTLMEDEWEQGNPGQPKYYKGSLNVKRVSVLELSYNPINRPICDDGPQPDFPLAAPLDREYQRRFYLGYNRPQTICAAALLGGNRVYNAGAYCHREDAENWDNLPDSRKLASLWFSWEVTPSLAWTMEYNPRFAIQIQKYCHQRCRCPFDYRDKHSEDAMDLVLDTYQATGFGTKPRTPIPYLLEDLKNKFYGQSACAKNGFQECSLRTKFPIVPATISYRPGRSCDAKGMECPTASNRFGNRRVALTCGSTCSGPAATSCSGYGTAGGESSCKCVVVQPWIATFLGLDPIGPTSYCLTAVALNLASSRISKSRYGKRSFEDAEWSCSCNTTFVSSQCCIGQAKEWLLES